MKELEDMTLDELKKLKVPEYVEQYYTIINQLKDNRISKRVLEKLQGEPITKIYEELMSEEENVRSHSFFPGDLVLVYPNIKEQKSKNFKTCDFSGAIIHPGSLYISYRPLLENITTNEKFVLERTIHVETGYLYNLPRRIDELEALEQDMILETPGQEIDFNHFNNQMGGHLPLKKLKKERRKFYDKNRNSKRP